MFYSPPPPKHSNINAYDHTRVCVEPRQSNFNSDYVNANYVPGYNSPKEFIATQGPLAHTAAVFWQMVWEQNASVIVMVTNLLERGRPKCHKYWPEGSPIIHGDLRITPASVQTNSTFAERIFHVEHLDQPGSSPRAVHQFQYLQWPDHGAPATTQEMLFFRESVRSAHRNLDSKVGWEGGCLGTDYCRPGAPS